MERTDKKTTIIGKYPSQPLRSMRNLYEMGSQEIVKAKTQFLLIL